MSLTMLVVDKDVEFSLKEQTAWRKRGIGTLRVGTMQEAIERLSKDTFYVVVINADNVNYLPLLKRMSDMSPSHLLIGVSVFSQDQQNEALLNGASGYYVFQNDPDKNAYAIQAYLQSIDARGKPPKKPPKTIVCGNLTIYYGFRQVFCNDAEIPLTRIEYNLLYYLMANRNQKMSYRQIANRVWGDDSISPNAIQQMVLKLRLKLDEAGFDGGAIESERGEGYRFKPCFDKV